MPAECPGAMKQNRLGCEFAGFLAIDSPVSAMFHAGDKPFISVASSRNTTGTPRAAVRLARSAAIGALRMPAVGIHVSGCKESPVRVPHFPWRLRRIPPAAARPAAPATTCPWVNSAAPISTRVSELMAQMSLSQEIALMTGASGSRYVGNIPAISSLCIPAMNLEDGPAGVGDGMSNVTQLPAPVDVAATWDTSAEQEYGHVIGAEQAAKGSTVDLGPTINIVRDPRWGRAFESIGEDPYLAGQLGAADIRGVQSSGTMAQ